jgi:hypothetical protein
MRGKIQMIIPMTSRMNPRAGPPAGKLREKNDILPLL